MSDDAGDRGAALAFLQQLAKEVSAGDVDLPCFPAVVGRISSALANPKTTSNNVVTIVGTEPRLAARMLQTANSAAFNSSGQQVSELRSAITRIGQQMVQSIAAAYAMQRMQQDAALRSIFKPMAQQWKKSVAVAAISQLLAERTKVHTDVAFLTGLLHGIGRLYIMARGATRSSDPKAQQAWMELLDDWQASIGKAVLENWGFAEEVCAAVGEQDDHERKGRHDASLTDVLIASIVLAEALEKPEPRTVEMQGVSAFAIIGLTQMDCQATLLRAERRISVVHAALR